MRRFFGILTTGLLGLLLLLTGACTRPSDTANNQTAKPANSANQSKGEGTSSATTPAANPAMGAIKIGSRPPGASVMLIADEGGEAGKPQLRGASPTTIADLEPGKYTVHLELKGYKYFQKVVEVKAGETVPVTADLQKQ